MSLTEVALACDLSLSDEDDSRLRELLKTHALSDVLDRFPGTSPAVIIDHAFIIGAYTAVEMGVAWKKLRAMRQADASSLRKRFSDAPQTRSSHLDAWDVALSDEEASRLRDLLKTHALSDVLDHFPGRSPASILDQAFFLGACTAVERGVALKKLRDETDVPSLREGC